MSCSTCANEMQTLRDPLGGFSWCPICGTIRSGDLLLEVPKLVERCRLFGALHGTNLDEYMREGWSVIHESIHLPEQREEK